MNCNPHNGVMDYLNYTDLYTTLITDTLAFSGRVVLTLNLFTDV